jgi:ribonuclease R
MGLFLRIEELHHALPTKIVGRHLNDICAMLDLSTSERPVILQLAQTLVHYGLIEEVGPLTYRRVKSEIIGTIAINTRGFGFVTPELGEAPNVFIDPLDLGKARHKDRVQLRLYTAADGRLRGQITQVLERGTQTCVGVFRIERSSRRQREDQGHESLTAWLTPQNDRLPPRIRLIEPSNDQGLTLDQLEEGSLIAVALTDHPDTGELMAIPLHQINPQDPQGQLEAVIYEQGIKLNLSKVVQEYAEQFPDQPSPEEIARRKDLRHLPFITIDPNTAKDFDDALYVQRLQREDESSWVLWVAIADVAHYVRPNTPIDDEAQSRGATLYLPAQAFPMLPHRLSNDLCSLKPKVDRLAMVARIAVSNQGEIEGAQFYEAIIHSQARLTYDEAAILLGILPQQDLPKSIKRQEHNVSAIRDCARALKTRRRRRGFLNLDLIEPQLNFDLRGMVEGFKVTPRHEAHEMVEESMLAANESVASLCIDESIPALYRIHASPPDRGIDRFVIQSSLLGAPLETRKKIKAHQLSRYLKQHSDHPCSELLSSLLLRAMSRAVYDPEPNLHFGLGTETYLHFTSPIRRYPDLWVHRQLKAWLNEEPPLDPDQARDVAGYASRRERLIMEAGRKVLDAYKALFMRDHVGETLSGVVCQTSPKGFMVNLDTYPVWCAHQVERLPGSFRYDEQRFTWYDAISRRRVTLGSAVDVTIIRADVSEGRVEVILNDL